MNTNIIQGEPTKKFFIEMITRDISIEDAIIDLLDNSIDGANKINQNDYSGLKIELKVSSEEFSIKDNCGGFSLETAQKYAFRFGRPDDAPKVNNTVGRFGIGMKRSLFKIGKNFVVESKTDKEHFKINVDVDDWSRKKIEADIEGVSKMIDDWNFNYEVIENENDKAAGTFITVTNLNKEVKDLFSDSEFLTILSDDIQKLLNFSLLKGIEIKLNGTSLKGEKIELLYSDESEPYYVDGKLDNVHYRIIAGLGGIGDPKQSGWYIYCNNRLVMEADTSSITGWGITPIPKFHLDYVMFRGILFLDSEETLDLPLTTTKKGIDATSEIYKAVVPLMKNAMVSILNFLKEITRMGDRANEYRQMLCETFDKKTAKELKTFVFNGHKEKEFGAPKLDMDIISQKRETVRIAFDANKNAANAAKLHAEVRSYKELGELSLKYYLQMEDIDYEES